MAKYYGKKKKQRAKKRWTIAERQSYKRGFFFGLFRKHKTKQKSKPVKKQKSKQVMKTYDFSAFNDNCDVFNVHVKGTSRSDALRRAKKLLKRDPERPFWGIEITNDKADSSFYRHITIENNGKIFDNWKPFYRAEDDAARAKYKDLSKPV